MDAKTQMISNLFTFSNQIRLMHWQTTSYALHKALDEFYEFLQEAMDKLIECYQGKYGIITLSVESISTFTTNLNNMNIIMFLDRFHKYFSNDIYENEFMNSENDLDIQDIIIDILNAINKLKYLINLS